jgi:hypothetical protein
MCRRKKGREHRVRVPFIPLPPKRPAAQAAGRAYPRLVARLSAD